MAGYQGGNYNAYSNQGYGNSNNYNTTAYGATGGEGGGGFMNGSQGGGSSQKKDNPVGTHLLPCALGAHLENILLTFEFLRTKIPFARARSSRS